MHLYYRTIVLEVSCVCLSVLWAQVCVSRWRMNVCTACDSFRILHCPPWDRALLLLLVAMITLDKRVRVATTASQNRELQLLLPTSPFLQHSHISGRLSSSSPTQPTNTNVPTGRVTCYKGLPAPFSHLKHDPCLAYPQSLWGHCG